MPGPVPQLTPGVLVVLVRARRVAAALLALLVAAALTVVLVPPASAAPVLEPVAVSVVVGGGTPRIDEDIALTVTLNPSTATGTLRIHAWNRAGTGGLDISPAPIHQGTLSTKIKLVEFGTWTILATYSGDATHAASSGRVQVRISASLGQVIITELRTSGPAGAGDYYVELTNTGRGSVRLAGFTLVSGSGTRTVLPYYAPDLGTGKSYLVAGKTFSLGAVATPDLTGYLGTGGYTIVAPDDAGTVTDAVGPVAGPHRGRPLPTISGATAAQWAFVRIQKAGRVVDTGQNGDDFALVSSDGGKVGGVQSMRGSASPAGLLDELRLNTEAQSSLLDPSVGVSAQPNRRYVPGSPGGLEIRRTITNTGTRYITSAKVRVTSLSEANGLPYPGATQPAVSAALRAVNPKTSTTDITLENTATVKVQNLRLDPPITAAAGGGLNSTYTIPLPRRGLRPGETVNVAFTFEVDVRGTFWFGYDVEGFTSSRPSSGRTPGRTPASTVERRPAAEGGSRPEVVAPLVRGTL